MFESPNFLDCLMIQIIELSLHRFFTLGFLYVLYPSRERVFLSMSKLSTNDRPKKLLITEFLLPFPDRRTHNAHQKWLPTHCHCHLIMKQILQAIISISNGTTDATKIEGDVSAIVYLILLFLPVLLVVLCGHSSLSSIKVADCIHCCV